MHMQVRQVPLRHELGSSRPARAAACSKGSSEVAVNSPRPSSNRTAWPVAAWGAPGVLSGPASLMAHHNRAPREHHLMSNYKVRAAEAADAAQITEIHA